MAKVFQILVPDNTLGSRIISCENQVTELYVIDRKDKKFVSDYSSELNKPALYILVNRDKRQLYVGETDDSIKRLRNHEAKDFWTEAIVFHSTTDTLSTTEVKWLEAKTYEELKELGFYDLSENKQVPQQPPLKRNQIYTLEPIFEEAKNYVCAAGFDIFLKRKVPTIEAEEDTITPKEPSDNLDIPQNNIWLLPSNIKRFNLDACFKEYGEVFWRITNNSKRISKGDKGFIYSSAPDKAILYHFDVIESNISYSKEMDRDDKFSKGGESNKEFGSKGGLFVLIRLSSIIPDNRFSLEVLLKNGLNGAPQSALRLSQEKFTPLLKFIESHFNVNELTKLGRRPPFKFSMIGLKQGDIITFAPSNLKVKVVSDNTIEFNNAIYTLSNFCKVFMPDKDRSKKQYQGPAYFTYEGQTLDKIRKEKENLGK